MLILLLHGRTGGVPPLITIDRRYPLGRFDAIEAVVGRLNAAIAAVGHFDKSQAVVGMTNATRAVAGHATKVVNVTGRMPN